MNRKLIYFLVSIAYLILIAIGLYGVYTVEATLHVKETPVAEPQNKISIAHTEIFGKLERPQVIFDHGKHVEAMKAEGCAACHPVKKDNVISFDFPKKVKGKSKTDAMNAFHDECIECHKKQSSENKKSGPVTCADCHNKKNDKIKIKYPIAEFDFSYHDKHVRKLKEKIGKDDCGQCHHFYSLEEKKLVYKEGTEESCYYCHDLNKKRGPELTAITKVSAEKGLTIKNASHQQCLNCHLKYQKQGDKETGPTECIKCHTGKYKTVEELSKVSRPDRKQKDRIFISVENSKMKGVPFDHKNHEMTSKTCRSCHHETLKACKECHTLTGKPEGNGINLANAYHQVFSEHSCTGCHNKNKQTKECAGCHYAIPVMDVDSLNPKKDTCNTCHSGQKEKYSAAPIPMSSVEKVKKEIEIKVLENEYEPSKFPHLEVIKKLVKISNDNKMATYFHRNAKTLCEGCHHRSNISAEAQQDTPPNCKNCHMVAYDRKNPNKTRLLSAYHRQCVGCHDQMQIKKGSSFNFEEGDRCGACHKKKVGGPAEIITMKNDRVVKQNTTNIINVWHPE